jgi:hypothetical protein
MARIRKTFLAASLLAALCAAPARAQEASPPMAFGQEMPQQFLINRLTNPSRATVEQTAREDAEAKLDYSRAPGEKRAVAPAPGAGSAPAPGAAGAPPAAEVAGAQPADNGNYYDPYPKQFLVNRLLGGGGN